MKKIILICLATVALAACKKEGFTTFNSDADIYFDYQTRNGENKYYVIDSLVLPFNKAVIFKEIEDSTLYIPVVSTGKIVDYDRRFKIVVDEGWQLLKEPDNSVLAYAAEKNVDYEIYEDWLVIKANEYFGYVIIKLLKPEESDKTLVVKFGLIDNENFSTNYKTIPLDGSTTKRIPVTEFKIYFNNKKVIPKDWAKYNANNYYGKYSFTKLDLLIELTPEIPVAYWYMSEYREAFPDDPDIQALSATTPPSPYSVVYSNVVGKILKNELAKRKEANGGVGLKDEDNEEMFAGPRV